MENPAHTKAYQAPASMSGTGYLPVIPDDGIVNEIMDCDRDLQRRHERLIIEFVTNGSVMC
jgi:hypothetical protein